MLTFFAACASPPIAIFLTALMACEADPMSRNLQEVVWAVPVWIVVDLLAAGGLFLLTLRIFDRKLGRVTGRKRPKPQITPGIAVSVLGEIAV